MKVIENDLIFFLIKIKPLQVIEYYEIVTVSAAIQGIILAVLLYNLQTIIK